MLFYVFVLYARVLLIINFYISIRRLEVILRSRKCGTVPACSTHENK